MSISFKIPFPGKIIISIIVMLNMFTYVSAKAPGDTSVYLITCGPGTEIYSIYGHSALRVVIPADNKDTTYNWGVFDFSTPYFAWKFAKGRLNYMLDAESFRRFLSGYFYEKRFVISQKINLNSYETKQLLALISENLKPENVKYRYDFFYDDCSTRIRDLLERSVGEKLHYPSDNNGDLPTFRDLIDKYQKPYPWLKFGIDLLVGSPAEKKAYLRDRMFLPIDLKDGLSETTVERSGEMIPLLQDPEVILDFDTPVVKQNFFSTPVFVFSLLLLIVLLLTILSKAKSFNDILDAMIFLIFSALSIIMIFFNFFSDHQQLRWNLNIIWSNPFLIICLITIIINQHGTFWFRIVFFITVIFLLSFYLLPQAFNPGIFPLVLLILIRSSVRAGYKWNPLSIR